MFFKKKEIEIGSPAVGECVPMKEVPDPTFSEEMLGKGAAIIPSEGKIYAPIDGEVSTLFPTLHAIGITTKDGLDLLVHIGIDTVNLKGDGFVAHVKEGDKVKKGDLLLEVDLSKLIEAGYNTSTPVIVCNTDDYKAVEPYNLGNVKNGDCIVKIKL